MTRTALTYPRIPLNGVYIPGVKSIEGATGDTARTTNGWIENEKYGWNAYSFVSSASAEFDTAVTRTGNKTLLLQTLDTTGKVRATIGINSPTGTVPTTETKYIPVKASTQYIFSVWIKTDNVVDGTLGFTIYDFPVTFGDTIATRVISPAPSGTTDWTKYSITFTTTATTRYLCWAIYMNVAGNVSSMWIDVNSITLIEQT